jgi:NAD(P)H dehydrogenase (quinone)
MNKTAFYAFLRMCKKAEVYLLGIALITHIAIAKADANVIQEHDVPTKIAVVFQSGQGGTYKLAQAIAKGAETVPNVKVALRQIPAKEKFIESIPEIKPEDLSDYDGIALGSPVHFAGSTPEMRQFLDRTLSLWGKRSLEGKPATVFMSAGSGAGSEMATISLWGALASHGMVIVPTGIMGMSDMNKQIPQGISPFGTISLGGMAGTTRPSESELHIAELQGQALAKAARAVQQFRMATRAPSAEISEPPKPNARQKMSEHLAALGLNLTAPNPAGNYVPYKRVDNLIFVNQVALSDGVILHPGTIGVTVSEAEARKATRLAMSNVLAVLQQATDGDLSRVKQVVQLTGFFNTAAGFKNHASLMNEASDLVVSVFGEAGKHTRATVGAASLPLDSAVEIQAVFEIDGKGSLQ